MPNLLASSRMVSLDSYYTVDSLWCRPGSQKQFDAARIYPLPTRHYEFTQLPGDEFGFWANELNHWRDR